MSLDAIPAGATVLIDANLLIYAVEEISPEARRLLDRCATRELAGFVSAVVVAEFCHRRMMQEAQSLGLVGSNPANALGRDAALVRRLTLIREATGVQLRLERFAQSFDRARAGRKRERGRFNARFVGGADG